MSGSPEGAQPGEQEVTTGQGSDALPNADAQLEASAKRGYDHIPLVTPDHPTPTPAPDRPNQPEVGEIGESLRAAVTPERARLLSMAAIKNKDNTSDNFTEAFKSAKPEDLPAQAVNKNADKRRDEYWKEGDRANLTFSQKNEIWNKATRGVLSDMVADHSNEEADPAKRKKAETAVDTLKSLGFDDVDKLHEDSEGLHSDVENFRKKYLKENSKVDKFVEDVAKDCMKEDDPESVDVDKLKERLTAIKPLLTSFGDKSVDDLVEDYAISYGALKQKEETKESLAPLVNEQAKKPIANGEKQILYDQVITTQKQIDEENTRAAEQHESEQETGEEEQGGQMDEQELKRQIDEAIAKYPPDDQLAAYKELAGKIEGGQIKAEDLTDDQKQLVLNVEGKLRESKIEFGKNAEAFKQALRILEDQDRFGSTDEYLQQLESAIQQRTLKDTEYMAYQIFMEKNNDGDIVAIPNPGVRENQPDAGDQTPPNGGENGADDAATPEPGTNNGGTEDEHRDQTSGVDQPSANPDDQAPQPDKGSLQAGQKFQTEEGVFTVEKTGDSIILRGEDGSVRAVNSDSLQRSIQEGKYNPIPEQKTEGGQPDQPKPDELPPADAQPEADPEPQSGEKEYPMNTPIKLPSGEFTLLDLNGTQAVMKDAHGTLKYMAIADFDRLKNSGKVQTLTPPEQQPDNQPNNT